MVSKENIKKNQYYQYRQLPIKDLLFVIVFFFSYVLLSYLNFTGPNSIKLSHIFSKVYID